MYCHIWGGGWTHKVGTHGIQIVSGQRMDNLDQLILFYLYEGTGDQI